jgi:enamine deaminase RidA (YjgF/YER057c/UK114 family)
MTRHPFSIRSRSIAFVLMSIIPGIALASTNMAKTEAGNKVAIKRSTPDVGTFSPELLGPGISSIVRVGNTVYLSGIVAARANGEAAASDMAGQIKFILEVLTKTLATENMTLANVVATTTYCTDMNQLLEHGHLFLDAFKGKAPTSTWVEVKSLASPDFLVEFVVVAAHF